MGVPSGHFAPVLWFKLDSDLSHEQIQKGGQDCLLMTHWLYLVIPDGRNSDNRSEEIGVIILVKITWEIGGEYLQYLPIHRFGHFTYWAPGDSSELWDFSPSFSPSAFFIILNFLVDFVKLALVLYSDIWSVSLLYIYLPVLLGPCISSQTPCFPVSKSYNFHPLNCLVDSTHLHLKGVDTPGSDWRGRTSPTYCESAFGASRNGSLMGRSCWMYVCICSFFVVLNCLWMMPEWLFRNDCFDRVELRVWE